jgi:tetratricopeptide (TPR) repeat protein
LPTIFSRFFGQRPDRADDDGLDAMLASLEAQIRTASPGYETQFLNRAGNLCVDAGQPARALGYYGRAIDAYLESGRFNAAEVLCGKVLEIAPDSVRPRCTLAWLALAKGFHEATRQALGDYVWAAERYGQTRFATKQLAMMAEAVEDIDLRAEIADHLLALGDPQEAERIFASILAERNGLRSRPPPQAGKLWAKVLRGAMMKLEDAGEAPSGSADEDSDALPSLAG